MDAFSEPEAFRLFVEGNFTGLASFAQSVLGSSFEAEDVAQEALILLYRSRSRLRLDPVDSWFSKLPRRQRAIAHLHFAENRDAGEIADILGIAASTVRVQLGRIRSKLSASNPVPLKSARCPHAS
jgi:DNA-directed RNA polymerase specialized sigma24 family protein